MAVPAKILLVILLVVTSILADIPTNCTVEETVGVWTFQIGKAKQSNHVDCTKSFQVETEVIIKLELPNKATILPNMVNDDDLLVGTWTMIYDQGFEVIIGGKRYFAFQYYLKDMKTHKIISYCDRTFAGWVHNDVVHDTFPPTNWACYKGKKAKGLEDQGKVSHLNWHPLKEDQTSNEEIFELVSQINEAQNSWKATFYSKDESFMKFTGRDAMKTPIRDILPKDKVKPEVTDRISHDMPMAFDWRNVNGVNYVSDIRNQEECGSCYAFASMAMLESRIRIRTNNTVKPVLSTQNVVSCSSYSQGCEGGFPYLVAGKFAQDFGVIDELCYRYRGFDERCHPDRIGCKRTYVSNYGYVGGYFGACTEDLMLQSLVKYGPLAVSFEVYPDFRYYKSGVYHHTGISSTNRPVEVTNHVVVIVGYGIEDGQKFWTVKNSWGTGWGEDGFFRIRRGNDECAIESMAVWAEPYIQ